MTNVIPISEVRSKLPKIVELADSLSLKTYVSVGGKVKAAIVSARELELLEETLEILSDPETMKSIKRGEEDFKKGRLVDWEDIKDEFNL